MSLSIAREIPATKAGSPVTPSRTSNPSTAIVAAPATPSTILPRSR